MAWNVAMASTILSLLLSTAGFAQSVGSSMTDHVAVHIDAKANSPLTPVEVLLPAGTYDVVPIGTSEGGRYDAWNPWGAANQAPGAPNGWLAEYCYTINQGRMFRVGRWWRSWEPEVHASIEEAHKNAVRTRFRLSDQRLVRFFVSDVNYADNSGGVSLSLRKAADDSSVEDGEYRFLAPSDIGGYKR